MVLQPTAQPMRQVRTGTPGARRAIWGMVAVLCSAVCLARSLQGGWVPHDTGQLGHTAERVLDGELQHRDFDEPYTGALGHLHALAFRFLGISAESMRTVVFGYAILFVIAVYAVSLRVAQPWVAATVATLSAALTLPVYAASMPSWYNLFFMMFGLLALLQHADTGHKRWLFWAGCCAGCSLAIKITGLFFVATALLYLAFRSTTENRNDRHSSRIYTLCIIGACLLFALLGLAFLRGAEPWRNFFHFTVPLVTVAACLGWHQWRYGRGTFRNQLVGVLQELLTFAAGLGLILLLFLVPYLLSGAMADLYRGLFILPALRLEHAALPPPELKWLALSLPITLLVIAGMFRAARHLDRPLVLAMSAIACALVFILSDSPRGYFYVFQSLRNLTPLLVCAGLAYIVLRAPVHARSPLFLMLSAAALGSVVQYPYAYGTYFFYSAPLLVLAILYVVARQPLAPKAIFASLLVLALALAVWRIPQPDPRLMNGFYQPDFPTASLNLARCNLNVYAEDAAVYRQLVQQITSLTPPGGTIYAAPDCPQVYFLAGRCNPTRTFYDLFAQAVNDREQQMMQLLDRRQINVVVINHHPAFSEPLTAHELGALRDKFAHSQVICGARAPGEAPTELFTVFWEAASTDAASLAER